MKTNQNTPAVTKIVVALLAVWLALVTFLAGHGNLVAPAGTPPIPIVLTVILPIAVFLGAFRLSKNFREFVMTFDLRLAVMIHAWRFAGFGFLALYANGVLPGIFAWPAGLGDMTVSVTAPIILFGLIQRPGFTAGKSFVTWNLFGILDLVVAVGMGGLASALAHGLPGEVTPGPMTQLPLALIPAFLVPIFLMLHLTALFQSCRLTKLHNHQTAIVASLANAH
jgi:hypothetical protein